MHWQSLRKQKTKQKTNKQNNIPDAFHMLCNLQFVAFYML